MESKKLAKLFSWLGGGIRRRLLVWGLALLGLALILNTIAGSLYTRRQIKRAAAELQADIAARTANRIRTFVSTKLERLSDLSVSVSLYPLGSEEQRILALLLLKNDAAITDISVLNAKGMEVLKVSERRLYIPSELIDQSASDKYKKAIKSENYISQVYTSDKAEPYVTLAVPLRLSRQETIGVVLAEANLRALWETVGETRFGRAGYAYLVDEQGNLIAHKDPSLVLKRTNLKHMRQIQEFLSSRSGQDPEPGGENLGITGQPVLSTFARVQGLDWGVILEEPLDAALADVGKMVRYAWLVLAMGLLLGTLVILWLSNQITKPIRELHRGVGIIGGGNLDYRVEIHTGDEIEQLAGEFNKMAADLKSSYSTLEQKVAQRTNELSALYMLTSTVNQSLELDSVLREVIKQLTEFFAFSATRIFFLNRGSDEMHLRASFEATPGLFDPARVVVTGVGINGRVAKSGEAMIFEDIHEDPTYQELSQSHATHKANYRFFAVFPIKVKQRVVGTIVCIGQTPRHLKPEELRLIASMTDQIGVAIDHATLFQETVRRAKELSALYSISTVINQSLDIRLVLRSVMLKVLEIFDFEAGRIYLMDEGGKELRLTAQEGFPKEMALPSTYKPGEGFLARIFAVGEPIFFEDIQKDPEFHRVSVKKVMLRAGYRAQILIPVRAKQKIIGVVNFVSKKARRFSPDDIELIHSVADHMGVALENAALFSEIKQKSAELEKLNRELEEASRAKSEFMAAMSHELRTPLNVIIGNADLARDGFFGEVSEEQRGSLEKILRYSEMLLKLINDVLTLSKIEASKMSLNRSTFSLNEIISHAKTHVEQLNRARRLEVLWNVDEHLSPITTDALKLEEILQNLIGNAFKFTPSGRIEVRVRGLPEKNRVEFAVADTGIGIENGEVEKIFDEFHQLKGAHTGDYSGVGLGLSIVKKYLDLMHGDIRVESKPGMGSTFTFTIPCAV